MPRRRKSSTPEDAPGTTVPAGRGRSSRSAAEALRRKARALADADRRKDDFIALLAHELRGPLAPIRNALESLRRRRTAEGTPLERELLVIGRQLGHLARLVDDLLDVARITRGQVDLRRERLELADVVATAVEAVEPALSRRRQRLEVSLPEEPLPLDGDPVRLAQVLSNLLGNASKYSEPGAAIGLEAVSDGGRVTVCVRDEGIGIPSDRLATLFDRFDQIEGPRDQARGGLGLGLTLVKALTELHGGSVEVSSDGPGRGSAFTVHLPVAAPLLSRTGAGDGRDREGRGDHARRAPASGGGPRRTVLVVEDSLETAESFAELLRLAGHQVTAVQDGAAALEVARALRPEIVFLDIVLPGMTGSEVAARLARLPGPRPLLVALTGYGREGDPPGEGQAPFDRFLLKPVDLLEVEAILREPRPPREAG